jgi:hypothetical protein
MLANVRFGSKADVCGALAYVRFVAIADIITCHHLKAASRDLCHPLIGSRFRLQETSCDYWEQHRSQNTHQTPMPRLVRRASDHDPPRENEVASYLIQRNALAWARGEACLLGN